ncbi:hypothetical protein [Myroides odoratus]|uniref:hypothetical protein n=1 Tax=Myroides odoratus TaxID=256 RepID=UPI0033420A18
MKKILMYTSLSFLLCGLYSCSEESKTDTTTNKTHMTTRGFDATEEIEAFKAALREINSPENRPTPEEQAKLGSELSDKNKQILLTPAKKLIYATGVTETELVAETNNDINAILNKAFQIFVSLTSNN